MQTGIWMSFDLGLDGDYENLFHWIDLHDGKECGDNVAYFVYEADEAALRNVSALKAALVDDLREAVNLRPRDRIYVILPTDEGRRGSFIVGGRRQPPWAGFASKDQTEAEDVAQPDQQTGTD